MIIVQVVTIVVAGVSIAVAHFLVQKPAPAV